jgi:hypothetical protein
VRRRESEKGESARQSQLAASPPTFKGVSGDWQKDAQMRAGVLEEVSTAPARSGVFGARGKKTYGRIVGR